MQGNLSEIDLRSILQLIELGQRTGQLLVETASFHDSNQILQDVDFGKCNQQSWLVFFLNGQIIYCQAGEDNLSRIDDYLHHYRVEIQLDAKQLSRLGVRNTAEYDYIWVLLEKNLINTQLAKNIIHHKVHETLFDLLSLRQGNFIFHQTTAIAPQLTSVEITPLVSKITQQLQEWKQLSPHIQSAEQLPILADIVKLSSSLPSATVEKLQHWADGKKSLRQLARYLNRDILTVAKAIYPYVQQGWLQLVDPATINADIPKQKIGLEDHHQMRIVCIDDAVTICETVESILKPRGYEAIAFTNPLEALSLVFKLQPNLILCEIAMPELDGYEICAMLRQSTAFRFIPLIMLTSKDRFIDRVRARMVGATDYLTKPFNHTELLTLVEKYLNIQPDMTTHTRAKTC